MERYPFSQLQTRQQLKLIKLIEMIEGAAKHNLRLAKKDAEELKRFIHMARALAWISPNERNYYISAIDDAINAAETKSEVRG